MKTDLFEELLYEEEGPTLDFKLQQYPFSGADEITRSELVKDILGFTNAWRRGSEAFILIGVKEVRGGPSEVIGIDANEHLDDHTLQQFVNSRTNRPIQFRYEAFGYNGRQVGIIRISEEFRPIYLKKDYGKLKKDAVYVRRGSSTDPQKPASPEEVSQMGRLSPTSEVYLDVNFAHAEKDVSIGSNVEFNGEFCNIPNMEDIPDFKENSQSADNNLAMILNAANGDYVNENLLRELATYEFCRRLYQPTRLSIKNESPQAARNVRIEILIDCSKGIHAIKTYEMPKIPMKRRNHLDFITDAALNFSHNCPGEISIANNGNQTLVEIDCKNMQPGRTIYSDKFFVGIAKSGNIKVSGTVYSDSIPNPQEFNLEFNANIKQSSLNLKELYKMKDL